VTNTQVVCWGWGSAIQADKYRCGMEYSNWKKTVPVIDCWWVLRPVGWTH